MNLLDTIEKLNRLVDDLKSAKSSNNYRKSINTTENIDQYLEWYTDSKILFSEYYGDDNELYKEFKSFGTTGNGFVLMNQFARQYPIYRRLIEQILTNSQQNQMKTKNSKKIFISHSSLDEKVANDFVNMILQNGLGINPIKDVYCTSIDGLKIRSGEDFRNNIKENINSSSIVILLISQNYKRSEICLNEMGACWVLGKRVMPILIPPVNYKTVGIITEPLHCLNLLSESDISQLCDELIEELEINIKDIKVSRLDTIKKEFLDKHKNL